MGTFLAVVNAPPSSPSRAAVLTVSSNKGGVGKTTLAANLAIYLQALREDVPVLVFGLDDQNVLDRMFRLRPPLAGEGNLKHGWAERNLARVIQLGEYGIHYVPSPPDVALLKARAQDPQTLRAILLRTGWKGLVIIDTKSDLEALTLNALHAADRIIIPVADWASLEEAAKSFALLERANLGSRRARVLLTLVDRRSREAGEGKQLFVRLLDEVRRQGWPFYKTYLSRSPRVEVLNSGTGKPLSILHHGRGTRIHAQLHELAMEVIQDVGFATRAPAPRASTAERGRSEPALESSLRTALGSFAMDVLESWRRS